VGQRRESNRIQRDRDKDLGKRVSITVMPGEETIR
jgi:hypothetical protein